MLKKIQSSLFSIREICGIENHINTDDTQCFQFCILKKQKNNVQLQSSQTSINNFAELSANLDEKIPIALAINGKGILHKKLKALPKNPTEILSQVLPNANKKDFAFQVHKALDGYWISIIRRAGLIQIIEQYKANGLHVVSIQLGAFVIEPILSLLTNSQSELLTAQEILQIKNQKIENFSTKQHSNLQNYELSGEAVSSHLLVSFGAAFSYLISHQSDFYNFPTINYLKENFQYQQLIKKVGSVGLVTLLTLLIFNFMAFSWLNKTVESQNIQLSFHQLQLQQLDSLQLQHQEKEQFFKQNNILQNSKTSWYADQIAASIPEGISLSQLNIFPTPKKSFSQESKMIFEQHKIQIKGSSQRAIQLNLWIKQLKKMDWIKEVTLMPYQETREGIGSFELVLGL